MPALYSLAPVLVATRFAPIIGAMEKTVHAAEYRLLLRELKKLRAAANLSQRALAKRLKVAPSWVGKVETGERRVDLIEFCRIVAACGADPAETTARLIKRMRFVRIPRAMAEG